MTGDDTKQLLDQANQLVSHLTAGDMNSAMAAIDKLNQCREFGLYQEIGKLTRTVHDAIANFQVEGMDFSAKGAAHALHSDDQLSESRMVDVKDRLVYVIQIMEVAAHKTMDMVEDAVPASQDLRKAAGRLKHDWERLMQREISALEFRALYKQIDEFLGFAESNANRIENDLSNILLAQDYQDLSGQVLKRVIHLVHEIEDSLVKLVKMASHVDSLTGQEQYSRPKTLEPHDPIKAEGPIIDADRRDDVVVSQNDVDDLLSSLGF